MAIKQNMYSANNAHNLAEVATKIAVTKFVHVAEQWQLCCDYCHFVSSFKILPILRLTLISEKLKCEEKSLSYEIC